MKFRVAGVSVIRRREILVRAGAAGVLGLPDLRDRRMVGSADSAAALDVKELSAMAPAAGLIRVNGGLYRWSQGDFSKPPLGPEDRYMIVGQTDIPLREGAWVRTGPTVSPAAFGAIPGDQADTEINANAFRTAIDKAANARLPLALDGATYILDAAHKVNFARPGLQIYGHGGVLRYIGSGPAFILDQGGADGAHLEGMVVEDLVIVGGAGVTDGFYSRGVVRSSFRNIEVRAISGKAFHIRHAVSNCYDGLKYSPPRNAPTTAQHGLYVDNNGSGFYSADCVFINSVMEDFPGVGCQLADASGMLFEGGAFEGCGTGAIISAASSDNLFVKLWLEANRMEDVVVSGDRNGFVGGKFQSASQRPNIQIQDDARGTWFAGGGYIRLAHLASNSQSTSFHQVGIDENKTGTLGISGDGSFTRIGCTKVDASGRSTGEYEDRLGPIAAIGRIERWNPSLQSSLGTIVTRPALTQGSYQKIGQIVFAQCFINVASANNPEGELRIDGLPFASAARQPAALHATELRPEMDGALQARIDPNERSLSVSKLSGGTAQPCADLIKADSTLSVAITYLTSD